MRFRRLAGPAVAAGLAGLAGPAGAVFPFAPPNQVIAESVYVSSEDPLVAGTYTGVFVCLARAAKEARITRAGCVLTDASGGAPAKAEGQLVGPFAVAVMQASGIILPAQICATAWAIYEVDGKALEATDEPPCSPIG